MTSQEFVNAIKIAVVSDSVKAVDEVLQEPPGRAPAKNLVEMSKWFNDLSPNDRDMVISIVKYAVESTTFGFLCVLDGVRAIEGVGEKGVLELHYKKGNETVWLNNPKDEYLHNLLKE